MEFTKELVCRLTAITFGHIPDSVVAAAKMNLADAIGIAAGGASSEAATIVAKRIVKDGPCSLIGLKGKSRAEDAAWFNGVAMHSMDLDDISPTMMAHPTSAILPAALAAAETQRASGKSLLLGYILGMEAAAALGRLMNPSHFQLGWYGTGTICSVGAAVAAGTIFGLDDEGMLNAIGIAGNMAAGTRQNFHTMTKPLTAGNSARAGVVATSLAADGFTADQTIIEAPMGLVKIYTSGIEPDYVKVINRFANPFEFIDPGVSIRIYPTVAVASAAIDAALALKSEHLIDPLKIKKVDVGVKDIVPTILKFNNPKTPSEAKFSMQYCIAAALINGALGLEHFTDKAINDPVARDLVGHIVMKPHGIAAKEGETPFRTAVVAITRDDGKIFEKRVDDPKGSAQNPLTLPELLAKFEKVAAPLGAATVSRLWEALIGMEDIKNVEEIGNILK